MLPRSIAPSIRYKEKGPLSAVPFVLFWINLDDKFEPVLFGYLIDV